MLDTNDDTEGNSEGEVEDIANKKVKGDDFQVDHSFLASPYHAVMIAGFSLIASNIESWISSHEMVKVVIVGLGTGLLPMFLHKHMPFGKIQVMELDPVVGDLARRHFGFVEDERMKLCIGDRLTVVNEGANACDKNSHMSSDPCDSRLEYTPEGSGQGGFFHILFSGADSENPSSGMSCPPVEFLEESFLSAARRRLCEGGMLVVNLVARAKAPHITVPEKLKKVFAEVFSLEVDEDVNRVLFALPHASGIKNQDDVIKLASKLKELALNFAPWGNGPDIQKLAEKLRQS